MLPIPSQPKLTCVCRPILYIPLWIPLHRLQSDFIGSPTLDEHCCAVLVTPLVGSTKVTCQRSTRSGTFSHTQCKIENSPEYTMQLGTTVAPQWRGYPYRRSCFSPPKSWTNSSLVNSGSQAQSSRCVGKDGLFDMTFACGADRVLCALSDFRSRILHDKVLPIWKVRAINCIKSGSILCSICTSAA